MIKKNSYSNKVRTLFKLKWWKCPILSKVPLKAYDLDINVYKFKN